MCVKKSSFKKYFKMVEVIYRKILSIFNKFIFYISNTNMKIVLYIQKHNYQFRL